MTWSEEVIQLLNKKWEGLKSLPVTFQTACTMEVCSFKATPYLTTV